MRKKNSGGRRKTAPQHCTKKKPQPSRTRKLSKPQFHPIEPHHNLDRPRPTMRATTATTPSRRAQTNHRCHRPVPCHDFLGCQRGFFLCATTKIWTLVVVFLNWEAYQYTTWVLAVRKGAPRLDFTRILMAPSPYLEIRVSTQIIKYI